MRVVDRFPAQGFFKGPRTIHLRSLPAQAQLTALKLTLTPIENGTVGPGLEDLHFDFGDVATDRVDPGRSTGVTRRSGSGPPDWTELSFSGFRTLASVSGSNLANTQLQVDVGGLFVSVDANGTIPEQSGPFNLPFNTSDLPGLSVQRLRLTGASTPDVDQITLQAVASNLTVSIGDQPASWALPGELTTPVTTLDLAEFAQAALAEADVENGIAILPITIKTDTTARLTVDVEAEFHEAASGLPNGLPEMTLDYTHDGIADAGDDLLAIRVPTGMEIDPERTRIEIAGNFNNSEITYGSVADRTPEGALPLAPGHAAAAPISLLNETVVDAVDVLLSTADRDAMVEIDLREDFEGKPGDTSLLKAPASATLNTSLHSTPRWLSAQLSATVTVPPSDVEAGQSRLWVVVQCIAGSVDWSLNPAPVIAGNSAGMQTSENGGLSWRPARVAAVGGGLAPQLRLRRTSPVFKVPLQAEIGRNSESRTLPLDEFQPLGRVEFALDSSKIANAVNTLLADRRAAACPLGDVINNGGFADRDEGEFYIPDKWTVSTETGTVARHTFRISDDNSSERVRLLRIGDNEGPAQSISQVVPVSPGCPYRLVFRGFHIFPGARVELIWRTSDCGVDRVDELLPPAMVVGVPIDPDASTVFDLNIGAIPLASLDIVAPETAEQAELRVWAGPGDTILVDALSLQGRPSALKNPDLREMIPETAEAGPFKGWTVTPAQAFADVDGRPSPFSVSPTIEGTLLTNADATGRQLILAQRLEVLPEQPFSAGLETDFPEGAPPGQRPIFGALWYQNENVAEVPPLAAEIDPAGSGVTRLAGTVPSNVTHVELRIEIPTGAELTVIAIAADTDPPEEVPVSFLSEAPGRLNVRDFTVAFRHAPPALPPVTSADPCAPTPADAAPGDVCKPDPCCGKSGIAEPTLTASVSVLTVDRPPPFLSANTALSPAVSVFGSLPAASATARIAELASNRIAFGLTRRVSLSVEAINGVGEVRAAQLSTIGVRTVADLARVQVGDLVRRLDYSDWLARDLVEKARARMAARRVD